MIRTSDKPHGGAWRHALLCVLVASAAGTAAPADTLSVLRKADTLEVVVRAPGARVLALHIISDRNTTVARFGEVSPLQPAAWPDNRQPGPELWWPILDFAGDESMTAMVELANLPAGAQVSWNGWVWREKQAAEATMSFPAARLLQWENTLWIDRAGPRLTRFYVRRRLPPPAADGTAQRVTLRLLAPDWAGRIDLVGRDATSRESVLATLRVEAPPAPAVPTPGPSGKDLEATRLRAALAAAVDHTLASVVADPRDPMHGGLYLFYDLDARTYRTSHWIWGWGPSAGLLLEARRVPEWATRFGSDRLLTVARGIGDASLQTVSRDPASPVRGIPVSRWDRAPSMDFGHEFAITPCDAGFLAAWTWVRLGEATGDPKWREACDGLVEALDRLMKEFPIPPQNYWPDYGRWDNKVIDEAGFGVELFAELYRVVGDARMRDLGRRYMDQHLAALGRADGLWDRVHFLDGRPNRPPSNMTRGLGWPMEGLLATHRLLPEDGRYLELAKKMASHLLAAQQPGGWWVHRFDQPAEVWGEGMKGTALWCWLFYELHRQSGDPQYLAAARRALGWLLDRQNFGDDPRARGGLVAVSPHSAVGIRPWFRVSSTYGAAFFGLAVLEEMRLQERTAPVISGAIAGSFSTKTAIIRWTTDVAADGRVSYGTSTAYGSVAVEVEPTKEHSVLLENLRPGATYHFRAESGGATSADGSFTTAARIEDLWPVVSLSFDDGHISHFAAAFPLMRARNMRGAVNVITDRLANSGNGNMSLDQLHFLQRQGWEVDSHSRAHNRDKTLTDEDEIVGSITWLESHGIRKVSSYRVPGSNHSRARETLAASHYPLRWGNVIGGPPSPRFTTLPLAPGIYAGVPLDARQAATREDRVAKYKAAIDTVLTQRVHTHFIFHAIVDATPEGYHYTPAEFEALLDYLQAKGIRVIPPGELLQSASIAAMPPP